jgi:rhodanese-related sulfurtransferase
VHEVTIDQFAAAHAEGAFVLDVREPMEWVQARVPRATLLPMSQLHARLADLPRDRAVYVICATGNRSWTATTWLAHAGFEAYSVAGGTMGWARSGRPVLSGRQESVA